MATPLWNSDHPRVVAVDTQRVYLMVAPFLRGVQDGISGLVAWHKQHQKTQFLLRSTSSLLPNHLAPVLDDESALYWLHGLSIMRTDKTTGETQLWDARGSLTMAVSLKKDVLYSFNHNNTRQLLALKPEPSKKSSSAQVQELMQLNFTASGLYADAQSVWFLATPASLASSHHASSSSPAAITTLDLKTLQTRNLVSAPSTPSQQIRAFAPYTNTSNHTHFSGVYWVERETKNNRVRVQHLNLATHQMLTTAITDINEQYPIQADAHALYYFSEVGSVWDSTWALKRLKHGGQEIQTLAQGSTPPTSLQLSSDRVYWTDTRTLYMRHFLE